MNGSCSPSSHATTLPSVILIPYIIIPVLLLLGTGYVWIGNNKGPRIPCLLSWVLLPIFILQVTVSYILSAVILILASANADFCSGGSVDPSPDQTIFNILKELGFEPESLTFRGLFFYVDQCRSDNPFQFVQEYEDGIASVIARVGNFTAELEENLNDQLGDVCDEEVRALDGFSVLLNSSLLRLIELGNQMLRTLRCDNLAPLYVDSVYGGMCTHSVKGVTWAFSSFLVVAFTGMTMIMLRSSWYPLREADEEEPEEKEVVPISDVKSDDGYEDEPQPKPPKKPDFTGLLGQNEKPSAYTETY